MAHTIRLREPWQVEMLSGRCLYRRPFNCPTGLSPNDRVLLAVEQLPAAAVVRFNGQSLPVGEACWEIGSLLKARNEIVIEFTATAVPEPRPFGEVRLEIHTA
jgi:hypothetical protein